MTEIKDSKKKFKVIAGAILFILGIVWCLLISKLNKETFIPVSVEWSIAFGAGLVGTILVVILIFFKRNKSNTKPIGFGWCVFLFGLICSYFMIAFGSLVVVLFIWFNSIFATNVIKKVTLPIKATGSITYRGNVEYYVFVDFEDEEEQVYLNTFNTSTVDLTLQKGKFGYWIIREKSVDILH